MTAFENLQTRLLADSDYREKAKQFILARITIDQESQCWLWTGGFGSSGYAKFGMDRASQRAHRVAWVVFKNEAVPRRLSACHKCDERRCVNPDHVFLGTCRDNMQDCIAKKRFVYINHQRGEKHPRAKLTDADVVYLRSHHVPGAHVGPFSRHELARKFGVSNTVITRAVQGKSWDYLPIGDRPAAANFLSEEQKAEIRRRHKPHAKKTPESSGWLAKEFGVPGWVIERLLHGRHKSNCIKLSGSPLQD